MIYLCVLLSAAPLGSSRFTFLCGPVIVLSLPLRAFAGRLLLTTQEPLKAAKAWPRVQPLPNLSVELSDPAKHVGLPHINQALLAKADSLERQTGGIYATLSGSCMVHPVSFSTHNSVLRQTRSIKEHQVEALSPFRIIDG